MTTGQNPSSASVGYAAGIVPSRPEDLQRFLTLELKKVANAVALLAQGHIGVTNVAPPKPRTGDIRIPDGVNWNPSCGNLPHWYTGAVWSALGRKSHVVVNNNAAAAYTVTTDYVGFTGTQVASLAFTFPAASGTIDGKEIAVFTQAAVGTASTWSSSGATFVAAPATLAAGSVTRFIYNHATLQWLPS